MIFQHEDMKGRNHNFPKSFEWMSCVKLSGIVAINSSPNPSDFTKLKLSPLKVETY